MLSRARPGRLISLSFRSISSTQPSLVSTASIPRCALSKPFARNVATFRSFSSIPPLRQQALAETQESSEPQEYTKFEELGEHGIVHPTVVDTITKRMDIHTMTDVQRLTINECLDGSDVIAQARTGTGKTLAFLVPIVQRLLKEVPQLGDRNAYNAPRATAGDTRALIISPTRELAEQIAAEANKLVSGTSVQVQTAVGGTQKTFHLNRIQRFGCHILVGTPGRVKDILSDPYSGVRLENIQTFVLDEADRLLDIGFAPEISEIQSYMPQDRERQTLMFSATVPKEVVSLVRQTLRPDFKFIRTVDPDEAPTHARIPQHVIFMRALQNQYPSILEIAHNAMEAHKQDPANNIPFKAIVFFGSTAEVGLAYEVMSNLREPGKPAGGSLRGQYNSHPLHPCEIIQMSSRLTQRERTTNSDRFRRAESALLLSSDVTARGMDFPNVSHVIQIGMPKNSDDYIHRLGRTGRAGKPGQGWLLLNADERSTYRKVLGNSGINIDEVKDFHTANLDMTRAAQLPGHIAKIMSMVEVGVRLAPYSLKGSTYSAMLGVLRQQNKSRSPQTVIDMMNELARFGWGLETPPALNKQTLVKAGFSGVTGVNFADESRGRSSGGDRFGGDRYGGRDGGRGGGFDGGRDGGRGGFGGRGGGFGDRQQGGFGGRGGGRDNNDPFGRGVIGVGGKKSPFGG